MENKNNIVNICGEVATDFEFSHESYGEKFYKFTVATVRNSGTVDNVPVVISERIIDMEKSIVGKQISITGQLRTCNKQMGNRRKLILTVFVLDYEVTDISVIGEVCNSVELEGYICKEPTYRTTPRGREIADLLIAVNRSYGKSDYIPCILWGRSARYAEGFAVGTKLKLYGRVQSRSYMKKADNRTEIRVAYEVSVSKFEILEEDANEK